MALLLNRPLVTWQINAAHRIKEYDAVILSSDDDSYAQIARDYKIEFHKRPPRLATDEATALEVAIYIADQYKLAEDELISIALPTAPFTGITGHKLAVAAVITASTRNFEAAAYHLVTQTETRSQRTFYMGDPGHSSLATLITPVTGWGSLRVPQEQGLSTTYRSTYGATIMRLSQLRAEPRNWFPRETQGLLVPRIAGIDINTLEDLEYARFIAAKGHPWLS